MLIGMNRQRAQRGQVWPTFLELAALETDECVEWPFGRNGGYGALHRPGSRTGCVYTHRLALEMRGPPPSPGVEVAHGPCHNRLCMNYRHLYWATRTENKADELRDGTRNRGERQGSSRLTREQVLEIRRRHAAGERQKDIAADFGVTRHNVGLIGRRQRWAWL